MGDGEPSVEQPALVERSTSYLGKEILEILCWPCEGRESSDSSVGYAITGDVYGSWV